MKGSGESRENSGKETPVIHEVKLGVNYPTIEVHMSQRRRDEIRWVPQPERKFLVVFEEGSPFEQWYFEVPDDAGRAVRSHPVKPDLRVPDFGLQFKYSVISDGWSVDPKVSIKP